METKPRFSALAGWELFAPHCYQRIGEWLPGLISGRYRNNGEFSEKLRIFNDAAGFTEDVLHYLPDDKEEFKKLLENHLIFDKLDSVLTAYLQVNIGWTSQDRMRWLAKIIHQTIAYAIFLDARKTFLFALNQDLHLAAVASRLKGQAVEVEAGAYAYRDLTNVLKELYKVSS